MTQSPAPDDVFGHVTDAGTTTPAPARPAWARAAVATDVPALDDVLDGTVDVAGTFRDKPRKSTKKSGKTASRKPDRQAADDQAEDDQAPATPAGTTRAARRDSAPRDSRPPVRQIVGAGGRAVSTQGRRAVRLAGRRPAGVFSRRRTLVLVAAGALVAGVGAGAGADAVLGGAEPTATVTVAAVSPEECATAQVVWARAAAAQARMDLESPDTVRSGFVGARDALAKQTPPKGVAAEWAVVTDYVTTVADAVAEAEDDAIESTALTVIADLDTESMTTASEQITRYLGADCAA